VKQDPPESHGVYRLRQVVQEAVTGRIAAFNTPVEIH
jgi:LDH2 family malate/lactate/ureidoglycolate dehydrogenase